MKRNLVPRKALKLTLGISQRKMNIFCFKVKASRKRLKQLKEVAAYNVGQCLCSEHDVNWLNLPKTLEKLVKKFVNTFSGDYINDL